MEDKPTQQYFDTYTPHYWSERFAFAVPFIQDRVTPSATFIDVGCGDGSTLAYLKQQLGNINLYGMDISKNYLNKAEQLVGCKTILGSTLDDKLILNYANQFDFAFLGSVLHHLIGENRKESFEFTEKCFRNTIRLLKPEGCLFVYEPAHSPSFLMTLIFYIKKIGGLSKRRIQLFSNWINFGQPVVSYYTPQQLDAMISNIEEANLIKREILDAHLLGGIIKRTNMIYIIQKDSNPS